VETSNACSVGLVIVLCHSESVVTTEMWDELVVGIQLDDPRAVEAALSYLEDDPWEFRSGYLKGRLLHHLVSRDLDEPQRLRLRPVLVHYCQVGPRWEFSKACRLARRVHIPGLRNELVKGLYGADAGADVRCLRMLFAMRRPRLSGRDRQQAQRVLVEWAGQRQHDRWDARWLAPTVRRLWPGDAVERLVGLVEKGNEAERRGAKILVRAIERA
jgi:hypothetical protein